MPLSLIDLTHPIETGMPVFPGSRPVDLSLESSLEINSFNETRMDISTHTGTHIDCSYHLFRDGSNTMTKPADSFYGTGMTIDCRGFQGNEVITQKYLKKFERSFLSSDFILLLTGWSRFWGSPEYYSHFPVMDKEAAIYLSAFNLKGIGSDTGSFDPEDSDLLPVHHILLSSGMILIENLVNLENLPENGFIFSCLPLRIKNGDGSPVRAVGIVGRME